VAKSISKMHVGIAMTTAKHLKAAESELINTQLAAFLAKGGVIQMCSIGERGETAKAEYEAMHTSRPKKKHRGKKVETIFNTKRREESDVVAS